MSGEWRELWRPFLEEEPHRIIPFISIIYNAIWLYKTKNIPPSPSHNKGEENQQNNAHSHSHDNHQFDFDRIVARALKLLSHLSQSEEHFNSYILNNNSIIDPQTEMFQVETRYFPPYYAENPRHTTYDHTSLNWVIPHVIQCSQSDVEDENIRSSAIYALCSFTKHRTFYQNITNFISPPSSSPKESMFQKLTETAVNVLKTDESIQVVDRAVELVASLLTAPPLQNEDEYDRYISCLETNHRSLFTLFSYLEIENGNNSLLEMCGLQIINLVYRLACENSSKIEKNSGILLPLMTWHEDDPLLHLFHSRGRNILIRFHVMQNAIRLLEVKDRILRFRIFELIQQTINENLLTLYLPPHPPSHHFSPFQLQSHLVKLIYSQPLLRDRNEFGAITIRTQIGGVLLSNCSRQLQRTQNHDNEESDDIIMTTTRDGENEDDNNDNNDRQRLKYEEEEKIKAIVKTSYRLFFQSSFLYLFDHLYSNRDIIDGGNRSHDNQTISAMQLRLVDPPPRGNLISPLCIALLDASYLLLQHQSFYFTPHHPPYHSALSDRIFEDNDTFVPTNQMKHLEDTWQTHILTNKYVTWIDILLLLLSHPTFNLSTPITISVCKNIRQSLHNIISSSSSSSSERDEIKHLRSLYFTNEELDDEGSNSSSSSERSIIDTIIKIVNDSNRPPIVINECLQTLSSLLSFLYKTEDKPQSTSSTLRGRYSAVWEKISKVVKLLSFNPMWDKKDNFLTFITSLYVSGEEEIKEESRNRGFIELVINQINDTSEFVRSSSLQCISTLLRTDRAARRYLLTFNYQHVIQFIIDNKHKNDDKENYDDYDRHRDDDWLICNEDDDEDDDRILIKKFHDFKFENSFYRLLILKFTDEDELPRRAAVKMLNEIMMMINGNDDDNNNNDDEFCVQFLYFCFLQNPHFFTEGFQKISEDIDYEVKVQAIKLFESFWSYHPHPHHRRHHHHDGSNINNMNNDDMNINAATTCRSSPYANYLKVKIAASCRIHLHLFNLIDDYDRIPRQHACISLHNLKLHYNDVVALHPPSSAQPNHHSDTTQNNNHHCDQNEYYWKRWQRVFAAHLQHRLEMHDFEALAASHSRQSVYPDETDLRFVSTELENPIDCY